MKQWHIEVAVSIILLIMYGLFLWLGQRGAEFVVFLFGSFCVGGWIAKIGKAVAQRIVKEKA